MHGMGWFRGGQIYQHHQIDSDDNGNEQIDHGHMHFDEDGHYDALRRALLEFASAYRPIQHCTAATSLTPPPTNPAQTAPAKGKKGGKPPPKAFEWIVKGNSGKVRLTSVKKKTEKNQQALFDEEFDFTWSGSYFDLFKKKLHVEVWDWNFFSPNTYVASFERSLRELCATPMDQQWNIYNQIRKRGKVENVNVGLLNFTVVFQEVLEYTIKLSNWYCTLDVRQIFSEIESEDQVEVFVPFGAFDLHSPSHFPFSSKRVVSKALTHKIRYQQKWVRIPFGQLSEMKFRGTRMELEQGDLYISVYDKGSIATSSLSTPIGSAIVPLKSVIEVGVLSSDLTKTDLNVNFVQRMAKSVAKNPSVRIASAVVSSTANGLAEGANKTITQATGRVRNGGEIGKPTVIRGITVKSAGSIRGNLSVEVLAKKSLMDFVCGYGAAPVKLWHEFAQIGESNPPELRDYAPYNQSYLCVRVVQARALFPADETGFSDPYVVVRWGDQQLKTRIIFATLKPDFHEDLYFLVRSNDPNLIRAEDLAKTPAIEISVWDYDPAGSSDMLGSTKVYLHQITGCGVVDADAAQDAFDDHNGSVRIPTVATKTVNVRKRANPAAPLRPTSIQTRVYREELPLEGLPPDFRSTVTVECFFRGPDGDIKEHDMKIRSMTHTDLLVFPPLRSVEAEKSTTCLCHPVFAFEKSACPLLVDMGNKWRFRRKMCEEARPVSSNSAYAAFDKSAGGGLPPLVEGEDEVDETVVVDGDAGGKAVVLTKRGNKRAKRQMCRTVKEFWYHRLHEERPLPSRSLLYRMQNEQDPPMTKRVSAELRDLFDLKGGDTLQKFLRGSYLDCEFFMAKDALEKPHWLPQYLHPITPPNAMIKDPEEAKYMCIVSSKLPNAQFAAAQIVKAIEFFDFDDYHISTFHHGTWIDPATLLSMRKGDVKAHALLLCSLFLGLMTDAYVCLGYARTEPTKHQVLELRERARENRWPSKKLKKELEELRGRPQPHVWVMTRESSGREDYGDGFAKVGSVKFWDVTRGSYYSPLPNRWVGQNDEDLLQKFKLPHSKKKYSAAGAGASSAPSGAGGTGVAAAAAAAAAAKKAEEEANARTTATLDAMSEQDRKRIKPVAVLNEEDLLEDYTGVAGAPAAARGEGGGGIGVDVGVQVEDVFALGVGPEDDWGRPNGYMDMDGGGGVIAHFDVATDDGSEATAPNRKLIHRKPLTLEDLNATEWPAMIKKILSSKMRVQDQEIREAIPFTKIVAVFNNRNLWVNTQHYLHPCDVTYDLGAKDKGWVAVLKEDESSHISAFFPPRTLGPKLTQDRIAELRQGIEDELEAGIVNFRSARSIETKYAGRGLKKLVRKLLEVMCDIEKLDHSRKNGWDPKASPPQFTVGSVGYNLYLFKKRLIETLIATVPPGYKFRFGSAEFHNTDPTSVRLEVLSHAWKEKRFDWVTETAEGKDRDPLQNLQKRVQIHEENHDGKEVFAVAATVVPFFNQICTAKIGIVVIFPEAVSAAQTRGGPAAV